MAKIHKATVGIKFFERVFRISSQSGELIDQIFDLRRNSTLAADHFDSVGRDRLGNGFTMSSETNGYFLNIDIENVTYTHDCYDTGKDFCFDTFLNEFKAIWTVIDKQIGRPSIRRIGYVCEHRISMSGPSSALLQSLTPVSEEGFPARFSLSYEVRKNAGHGGLPDPTKDDFLNFIYAYYDSALDGDHPQDGAVNLNLDVQRYYSPALSSKVIEEVRMIKTEYDKASAKFFGRLADKVLLNG